MLRFGHSEYLWALWAIPAFLMLFIWVAAWKRRALKSLGDKEIVGRMMPQVSLSVPRLKFILFSLAFAFVVLGQRKKISVGYLAMTDKGNAVEDRCVEGHDFLRPKPVSGQCGDSLQLQHLQRLSRAHCFRNDPRIR